MVTTAYDEIRKELRDKLSECVKLALQLQDETIWGYDQMKEGYADGILETAVILKKVIKEV